jgi:homopolymeric O-antigen transport system ATP-binding protein
MVAIELHDVSKKYRRHTDRPLTTTLKSYFLYDLWRRRVRRENVIWALHNIDLHVDKGTTLGIIGRNGAGKSTLLKLLSGILRPDTGTVCAHGKVAALIELGAGFHPELTGRENIIINGIILGLSKKEIRAKLEEIVAFAELQPYIDEPVRTYSSGMYMRLGFSVAAHVDPEILLIDEVFAVGDAAFARKCMERMKHFKQLGKTMVLVTHDLDTVRNWCDKAVWLHDGMLKMEEEPGVVIDAYMKEVLRSEPYHER